MNTAEFLASLGSSVAMGLDDLNYDSIWDHSEVAEEEVAEEEMEEEEVAEEEMAREEMAGDEELEEVTEASTKMSRTHNYNQVEDIVLCYAWMNISMDATDQTKDMFWERIAEYYKNSKSRCNQIVHKGLLGIVGAPLTTNATDGPVASIK
jgi:hypothetical protein